MAFLPIVVPEQLSQFEEFAYNSFPAENTAVSSFGRGVFGIDDSLNTTDNRYHESDGTTPWNSPFAVFFPMLQHVYHPDSPQRTASPHPLLLFNFHADEVHGRCLDDIINCSRERRSSQNAAMDCSTTGRLDNSSLFLIQPIYPETEPFIVCKIYISGSVAY